MKSPDDLFENIREMVADTKIVFIQPQPLKFEQHYVNVSSIRKHADELECCKLHVLKSRQSVNAIEIKQYPWKKNSHLSHKYKVKALREYRKQQNKVVQFALYPHQIDALKKLTGNTARLRVPNGLGKSF